jgi:hypothetical protein
LLLAFFGACLVLAVRGALLVVQRSIGVVLTLAGMVMCAPFWWGFNLPLAWVNAAVIMILFALASVVRVLNAACPDSAPPGQSARIRHREGTVPNPCPAPDVTRPR